MEKTIHFPQFNTRYAVRGGPDTDELLDSMKRRGEDSSVTFTFIGEDNGSFLFQDVIVRPTTVKALGAENVFEISGSVASDTDIRFRIECYNAATKHGTGAGLFL